MVRLPPASGPHRRTGRAGGLIPRTATVSRQPAGPDIPGELERFVAIARDVQLNRGVGAGPDRTSMVCL
jgi:hypothetical protein